MTGCADCSGCLDRAHLATAGPVTASPGPCGGGSCCAGVHPVTPRAGYNRPGLAAIDYRVGTHHDLLESMIARLASRPELAGYTTRAPDDPGIALLDSWALTGDIVTFYTERAANEGYLGTATQPDSLALLGRLVDYQPRPAVGASGYLAFTMDPGAAGVIAAGLAGAQCRRAERAAADLRDVRDPPGTGGLEPARGSAYPPAGPVPGHCRRL